MVSLLKACETANIKKGAGPMLRPWKFSLSRDIDPRSETPIYLQVVHALIQDIRRGRLLPGTILPSTRAMADTLGVNRKTIVLAYDDLVAQGWLKRAAREGRLFPIVFRNRLLWTGPAALALIRLVRRISRFAPPQSPRSFIKRVPSSHSTTVFRIIACYKQAPWRTPIERRCSARRASAACPTAIRWALAICGN